MDILSTNNIGAYRFTVEPFQEDFTGRISWFFLGNHLLRCASLNAGEHGFGYDDMIKTRHAWVLSRLVVEMEQMPMTGNSYTIETWVNRTYRQFTDRLFTIKMDGKEIGHAHSVWALIDIDSRQPADLEHFPDSGLGKAVLPDKTIPIKGPGRLRMANATKAAETVARYSDLDINGHVNSIRYIQTILDLFPVASFESSMVKRIEVAYCGEAYAGDRLSFFTENDSDNSYKVEIKKNDSDTVVKAAIEFK